MKKAANDNTDTWTHISLAALRVLTQIKQEEEFVAGVEHGAQSDDEAGDDDGKRTDRARIVGKRKPSAEALAVREEGST